MKKLGLVLVIAPLLALLCAVWIAWPSQQRGEAARPGVAGASPANDDSAVITASTRDTSRGGDLAPADQAAEQRAEVESASPSGSQAKSRVATAALRVLAVEEGTEAPVEGEVVLLQPPGTTWHREDLRSGRTDSRGVAEFGAIAAGNGWVRLLRGGEGSVQLRPGNVSELRLVVPRGITVAGSVVDARGEAVADAEIWLSERYRTNVGHIVASTDRAGRFVLERVGTDQSLGARARGYAPSSTRAIRGAPGDTLELQFVLDRPGVRVRGVVRDERGTAIANAQVMLGAEQPTFVQRSESGAITYTSPPARAVTDANGEFTVESAPLGLQPLQARARGFAPSLEDVDTDNADRFPIQVRLARHARIVGRVVDEAELPIASVWIHTGNPERFAACSTHSGPDGKFELDGLGGGEVHVLAEHPSRGRASLEAELAPGETREWNVVLGEQPRIFGRVLDERGAPLEGWTVVAVPGGEESRRTRSQRVDASGAFAIVGLADETHTLWVHRPGAGSDLPALTLDDVWPSTEALELRVPDEDSANGRIVARVIGPDGKPAESVIAQLWLKDRHMWREFPVGGATGNLAIEHVSPGTCQIQLISAAFARLDVGERTVRAGETLDLGVIRLADGGRLIARLKGVADELIAEVSGFIDDSEHSTSQPVTPEHGELRSGPLATGRYRLSMRGDGVRSVQMEFDITAGVDTELDITLERCGTRLVVLDPPPNFVRPSWFSCVAIDDQGRTAWDGVIDISAPLEVRVSAPPGHYRFSVRQEQTVAAECALTIASLADPQPPLHVPLTVR